MLLASAASQGEITLGKHPPNQRLFSPRHSATVNLSAVMVSYERITQKGNPTAFAS